MALQNKNNELGLVPVTYPQWLEIHSAIISANELFASSSNGALELVQSIVFKSMANCKGIKVYKNSHDEFMIEFNLPWGIQDIFIPETSNIYDFEPFDIPPFNLNKSGHMDNFGFGISIEPTPEFNHDEVSIQNVAFILSQFSCPFAITQKLMAQMKRDGIAATTVGMPAFKELNQQINEPDSIFQEYGIKISHIPFYPSKGNINKFSEILDNMGIKAFPENAILYDIEERHNFLKNKENIADIRIINVDLSPFFFNDEQLYEMIKDTVPPASY